MVPVHPALQLVLDLTGTFVFALGCALVALEVTRLYIVGAITLGMVTAIGGGVVRDLLIGAVPPATFSDWPAPNHRYMASITHTIPDTKPRLPRLYNGLSSNTPTATTRPATTTR